MDRPRTCKLTLPDGRILGMDSYHSGRTDNVTVLYFHGRPGSRFEAGNLYAWADMLGFDVVSVDRPGWGLSTFHHRATPRSVAADLEFCLQEANVDRVRLLAMSGGAPFALEFAANFPDRVDAVAIVSGAAPYNPKSLRPYGPKRAFALSQFGRILRRVILAILRPFARTLTLGTLSESQRARYEPFRQGSRAFFREEALMRNWQPSPISDRVPTKWWHGESDRECPIELLRPVWARNARWQIVEMPGGHHAPSVHAFPDILAWLTTA